MTRVTLDSINEMKQQFAKQPWTSVEIDQALSVLDELLEFRAEAEQARNDQEAVVTVHRDGVQFGKWCWFSHESITGCEAALIPTKHKQYYEWFVKNLRYQDRAIIAAPPAKTDYATTVFDGNRP